MSLKILFRVTTLALTLASMSLFAQGQNIAIISIQDAIARTAEGQRLIQALQEQYAPKSQELKAKQDVVAALREQLNKGSNTMSEDARRRLAREIQQKERDAQRAAQDAQGEFNQEQQTIFQDIGGKLMAVIDKYSKDNGYAIVLDISSPQSPVLYAINEVNITNQVITLYDQQNPQTSAAPAAAPAAAAAAKPAAQ